MTGPNDAPPSRAYGRDYALINGVFAVGLSGLAVRLHRRGLEEPLTPREMTELALATFALADVFSHEKIAHWVREPFVEETADNRPGRPRGSGLRYAIGELMSCSRCVGSWSALALNGLRSASPAAGQAVTTVLATAGANDLLQAGFRLMRDLTNAEETALQRS